MLDTCNRTVHAVHTLRPVSRFREKTTMKLSQRTLATLVAAACTLVPVAGTAQAADYPSQPITFIVPYAAGGSSDTSSRQVAQKMSETLGVTIVVENKPGASGNIGTSLIARAKPD